VKYCPGFALLVEGSTATVVSGSANTLVLKVGRNASRADTPRSSNKREVKTTLFM